MSDEDAAPYERAHRAKRGDGYVERLDVGAIAVGMLPALGGFAGTMALRPTAVVGAVLLAAAATIGGYFTGHTIDDTAACVPCHGGLVSVVTIIVAVTAGGATIIADPDTTVFVFVFWERNLLAGTAVASIVLAGIASLVGAPKAVNADAE